MRKGMRLLQACQDILLMKRGFEIKKRFVEKREPQ
jgi:hypothetical protein